MKLPKGWKMRQLSEIAAIVRGSSPRPAGDSKYFNGSFLPWITVSEVTKDSNMFLSNTASCLTETGAKFTRIIEKNTLLLTNSGATLGVPKITALRAGANDGIAVFLELKQDIHFVYYFLQSKTSYFRGGLAPGVGQPNLNTELIGGVSILLPPLPEQFKIADILSTWDDALEKLDVLIAVKERRKKGLMQQLLTGKKQIKGFSKKWPLLPIPEVFERVERAIVGTPQHILSITAGKGFVDQREKFSRVIAGRNIENYVLLRKGEFAYNKGNSNLYPQGCVYRLEEYEEGAVPNVWISFRLKSKKNSSLFYKHFFLSGGLNHPLHRLINAGVRNDGLLNLTPTNFFSVQVPVPPEDEQTRLGALFEELASEISLLRSQRAAIDQQRRGLMQKLLTGAVRVRTEKYG